MKKITSFTLILWLISTAASATVKLPAIFGDNMVLQRGIPVPIYGWADAGERVTVDFRGKTYKATTGTDGKWALKLGNYKAGGPYQMHIQGNNTDITYSNILIGDVWLASGQSNMEFGIQTEKRAANAIANATDNQIHFFYVPMNLSLSPVYDVVKQPSDSPNGKWLVCSPQVLANPRFAWHGFSGVGLYFAEALRKSEKVPMGMIGSYRGGTPVEAWISVEGLKEEPAFTRYADKQKWLVDHFDEATKTYPSRQAAYRDSLKIWNAEVGDAYNQTLKQWDKDVAAAKASNQTPPLKPKPARPAPTQPADPLGGYQSPTVCYNGVIAPLVGYGLKGVIWYQGETNGDGMSDAVDYKEHFPRMIADWRAKWALGDFPFLFVQLPNFRGAAITPSQDNWPWVREGQAKTLSLPNTGMATIIDAGEALDVHPTNKLVPGNRLALVAQQKVYGRKVVASGPVYESMKIQGNKIIISFDEIHKGLTAGSLVGDDVVNSDDKELKGFGVAGEDHKFYWAKALITGNTVTVWADEVPAPASVRYNWADNPPGNLYNKNGLPARPFRTDDWPPFDRK
ncbi:sialate O-acetylesterase [Mucilaginibacter panaciglaebae]|uniref:Sialate O-acetylesterase n=1 Tax=Mucilaginibacter panaciglaebae TaxID=502331 RepID=A0ABP7WNG1_9SPHI